MDDLRSAWRALRSTPLVTAVAALSLALGVGANTAMFSIVDGLILRALPVPQAERLAILSDKDGPTVLTNPIWEEIRNRDEMFDGAFAWSTTRFNLAQSGETDYVDGLWASGKFFEVLRVPAILGRTFTAEDDRRGGGPDGPVAVISSNYWQSRYGGAADVVGKPITLNQTIYTIVGVTGPEFFGPEVGRTFDVAIPLGTEALMRKEESFLDHRSAWWMEAMVRLKPGQTIAAANAALQAAQPQIREATMPPNWRPQDLMEYLKDPFTLQPAATGSSSLRTRYQQPLLTIMVVVGLVLLIACGNIANLLLARATARRHELSVRQALGASRWRLGRQLFAESLLLAAAGAALGALIAVWGSKLLVRQLSTTTNRVFLDTGVDWRMLAFTAATAIGTALLFGVAPAMRAAKVQPIDALKEQSRGNSGTGRLSMGNGMVIAQVALSLVLVIAAGLFVRTFAALSDVRLGFDRDRVIVARVNVQRTGVDSSGRAALYDQLVKAAEGVPGVAGAAASMVTPIAGMRWNSRASVVDGIQHSEREAVANANAIGAGWFATYGTRILAGRDFAESDVLGAPKVAIVNQKFVEKFIGAGSPLGRVIQSTEGPKQTPVEVQIVGLVEDAVYGRLRDTIPATMYFPLAQQRNPFSDAAISIRASSSTPGALIRSVSAAINGVRPNISTTFRLMSSQVRDSLSQERLIATLSAFFGALALLLAGVGLYGVTMYSVNMRRSELGIRMALGSPPKGVMRLVLRRVALQVGAGVLLGTLASWWAAKFVSSLLYGLKPQDPLTIGVAVLVLASVGLMAGFLPAQRASRFDPMTVLREE